MAPDGYSDSFWVRIFGVKDNKFLNRICKHFTIMKETSKEDYAKCQVQINLIKQNCFFAY
jgi:hypothetical protein